MENVTIRFEMNTVDPATGVSDHGFFWECPVRIRKVDETWEVMSTEDDVAILATGRTPFEAIHKYLGSYDYIIDTNLKSKGFFREPLRSLRQKTVGSRPLGESRTGCYARCSVRAYRPHKPEERALSEYIPAPPFFQYPLVGDVIVNGGPNSEELL
ncbi:hypothetical protein LCGC14_2366120 [marine sediment metagenome]|uniref:Uncharacterized protein n=1 Tax=marine sediment metagenome TaxID=412755 RepID=A0A0F9C5E2_9ZZZZ